MTPGDLVSSFSELANNAQALAQQFDLPAGIPFVEDALADAIDFASRVETLTTVYLIWAYRAGLKPF